MYSLSVARDFTARHFLTVPDPGAEGDPHSHDYRAEVRFAGPSLNEFGYLVDIDDVNASLDDLLDRYRGTLLNDLPEFDGENPSVERFARHFCERLATQTPTRTPTSMRVRMWEDADAWASYEREC